MEVAGIDVSALECVGFYEKPLLKVERILETYMGIAPRGFRSFLMAGPLWMKEKLHIDRELRRELKFEGRLLYGSHALALWRTYRCDAIDEQTAWRFGAVDLMG